MKLIISLSVFMSLLLPCLPAQPGMLLIDQDGDYARALHDPVLSPATAFTAECWYRYDPSLPSAGGAGHMVRKDENSYVSYFLRVQGNDDLRAEYVVNGSLKGITAANVVLPLTWHHAAVTFDGVTGRLYQDFQLVASLVSPGLPATAPGYLTIGSGSSSYETFAGFIDEVRIWGRALSAGELQAHAYQKLDAGLELRAAWHFDDGSYVDGVSGILAAPTATTTLLPSSSPVLTSYLSAPGIVPIASSLALLLESPEAGLPYLVELSLDGNTPGIPLGSAGTLPLNPPLLFSSLAPVLPAGTFTNFLGFVPPSGLIQPIVMIPDVPGFVGMTLHSSFVILGSNPTNPIDVVGNGQATLIVSYAPRATGVSRPTVPLGGGVPLSVFGQHFQTGASVRLAGTPATAITVVGPGRIDCTAPAGGALGPVDVEVENPDSQSSVLVGAVSYVEDLLLFDVSPLTAPVGIQVQITGSGIQPGATLTLGGAPVSPLSVTSTTIDFLVPPGVPCDASIVVQNPDGQTASLPWNPSPAVFALIPASGPAGGGTQFFVLGANLLPGTTVSVGGQPATVLGQTPGALLVEAPPGTPGPATLEVLSPGSCSATAIFIYL